MLPYIVCKTASLALGTLYPAYSSYKTVKTRDTRGYTKWMMYWIIIAFFSAAECISDMFLFWLPLYYELKLVFIIWLVCPYTNGSTIMYKKFLYPKLREKEKDIDTFLEKTKTVSLAYLYDGLSAAFKVLSQVVVTGKITAVQILQGNQMDTGGIDVDVTDDTSTESGIVLVEESYQQQEDSLNYTTVIEESEDEYSFSVHSNDMDSDMDTSNKPADDSDNLEDDDYVQEEDPALYPNLSDGEDFSDAFTPHVRNNYRAATEPPSPSPPPSVLYKASTVKHRGTSARTRGDTDVVPRTSGRIRKQRNNY